MPDDPKTEPAPFDEDPPVDPEKPQVGNSRAKFYMPEEPEGTGAGDTGEAESSGEEVAESPEREQDES